MSKKQAEIFALRSRHVLCAVPAFHVLGRPLADQMGCHVEENGKVARRRPEILVQLPQLGHLELVLERYLEDNLESIRGSRVQLVTWRVVRREDQILQSPGINHQLVPRCSQEVEAARQWLLRDRLREPIPVEGKL